MKLACVRFALSLAGTLLVSATIASPARAQETIDSMHDMLHRPVVSQLTAASGTPRIAWTENARGIRNIWSAVGPEFTPAKLTDYQQDDGQPLSNLALVPDGSVLVYTRGSAPNAAGEIANPTSDPKGAERAIWAVLTDGSRPPWRLAEGGGGVVTPSGESLLFARGSQVMEVSLTPPAATSVTPETGDESTGAAPEPQVLFTARGSLGSIAASGDGVRIAFVSDRGDHAFIGLYSRSEDAVTWIEPSVHRDAFPVFSRKGRRMAFLRMPGAKIGERYDLTQGNSFSVWVLHLGYPRAQKIWEAPKNAGGFAQYYPPQPLSFAYNDDYLLFTSEHEGWNHLYRVALWDGPDPDGLPADEGAVDLTPGPGEIEAFKVSRDEETVLVWGNHGDPNRRHMYSLSAHRGGMRRLGRGHGIEVDPTPLFGGHLAFRAADAKTPMEIKVALAGGGVKTLAPAGWPPRFPIDDLIVPQEVTFLAEDDTKIHGQLFLPPASGGDAGTDDGGATNRPAVIFLHGGPIRQMLLGWHYSDYYANAYAFNQYLARHGYAVLAVNFRSGIGYGQAFRQRPEQGPRGAAEYQDVVAAGRFLATRDDVDGQRIGLWGGSYGGLLTAMGLARNSDLFAAGVDLHGVHDWAFRGTDFPLPGGAWGLGEADLELAKASSPVASVDDWTSPVLFVHGDDDRNVMFQQTTDLVLRLQERKVPVATLILPDEVHGFLRYDSWLRTFVAAFDFFEQALRKVD